MISYIKGTVRSLSREPARAVVVAGGVGYEIVLPVFVYQSLANDGIQEGSEAGLEVYYHVTERQPKPLLVGFRHPAEREFFEQLLEVEGIGPSKAAALLVFPPAVIATAIEREDLGLLQRLPGVGGRGAHKIVATLRGKVAATAMLRDEGVLAREVTSPAVPDGRAEAINVLVKLGYRSPEAADRVDEALRRNPKLGGDVQALIREVFRAQPVPSSEPDAEAGRG
jgi:Holliday junction DNA helicase RuvA